MSKSPLGAVLRSTIVPGWGQVYTGSYWKVPVIWGAAAWLIYNWFWNNNQYKQNQNSYLQYLNLYNQNPTSDNYSAYTGYLNVAHFYEDQRDLFAIYMGLTYLLNLVDAYIDAQLFDFSVSKDPVTSAPMLNMRLNF